MSKLPPKPSDSVFPDIDAEVAAEEAAEAALTPEMKAAGVLRPINEAIAGFTNPPIETPFKHTDGQWYKIREVPLAAEDPRIRALDLLPGPHVAFTKNDDRWHMKVLQRLAKQTMPAEYTFPATSDKYPGVGAGGPTMDSITAGKSVSAMAQSDRNFEQILADKAAEVRTEIHDRFEGVTATYVETPEEKADREHVEALERARRTSRLEQESIIGINAFEADKIRSRFEVTLAEICERIPKFPLDIHFIMKCHDETTEMVKICLLKDTDIPDRRIEDITTALVDLTTSYVLNCAIRSVAKACPRPILSEEEKTALFEAQLVTTETTPEDVERLEEEKKTDGFLVAAAADRATAPTAKDGLVFGVIDIED